MTYKSYICKVGLDYELVEAHEHKIKFYYEQVNEGVITNEKENFT